MGLAFRVEVALERPEFGGVLLIGPETRPGALSVDDDVHVPTASGTMRCRCVSFPLVNIGRDRSEWVRVVVEGVTVASVLLGHVAEAGGVD